MARCGCSGVQCDLVRPCLSAGTGISYDSATGVISASISCTQVRPCLSAGPGITYNSTTGVISADAFSCDAVRDCLSAGPGITFDNATGVISSPGIITATCGFSGAGTAASPLALRTDPWPFACAQSNGGGVYCDPGTGSLHTDPPVRMDFFGNVFIQNFPGGVLVPAGTPLPVVQTYSVDVINPDPCRSAHIIFSIQGDFDFTLPPGATASSGINGDSQTHDINNGVTTMVDVHHQFNRIQGATVGPGATVTITANLEAGRGTNGATYTRIQSDIHAWVISNP